MSTYKFDCGCELPILDSNKKECDGLPSIDIDFYNLRDCSPVWDLYGSGKTKGMFQLEKQLGQDWSKKILPRSINESAGLISVIRPGTLNAMIGKKNMTQIYSDRKNGLEEITYFYEQLAPILADTYGILVYQESALRIAKELYGFNLQEADQLRKAMGKKDPVLMTKTERLALEKAKGAGILDEDAAKNIFAWIRESNRYSFNKCLSPTTKVITLNEEKELKDVVIGEKVLAPKLDGTNEYVEVINIYHNGPKEVYRFTLSDNTYVECTLDHKFLASDLLCTIQYAFKNNYSLLKPDYSRVKIVQCEFVGSIDTIDIEVDSDIHLFYSNGVAGSNSHAVSYGMLGYWSAYVKHHFPLHFYTSWIHFAKDKMKPQEEMAELINDAKYFNIDIHTPSILNLYEGDSGQTVLNKEQVYLGIADIKRVGLAQVEKVKQIFAEENIDPQALDWDQFLVIADKITSTTVNGMISVGALSHLGLSRSKMAFEYNMWSDLTKTEKAKAKAAGYSGLKNVMEFTYGAYKDTNRRKDKLRSMISAYENPGYPLTDTVAIVANLEQEYLGLPITCSRLDACANAVGDTTCKEFSQGKTGKMSIAVEITRVKENIIKNGKTAGQTMAFLTVQDHTGPISNVVLFAAQYKSYKNMLYVNNTVLLEGKVSDKGSLAVDKVRQL